MKFDLGHKENFPTIGAQLMDDGEVLLTFNSYPTSSMMAVPLNVAVDFAKHILDMDQPDGGSVTIAEQVVRMSEEIDQLRQQVKLRRFTDQVTDDDFLHMIDESNFAQERE